MSHFSTPKHDGDLNLVLVPKKTHCLFDFKINVVLSRFGSNANLFSLGLMRFVLIGFLAFFVFVLSKVHNTANRWAFVGSHFHQIKAFIFGLTQSILRCNDS